MTGFVGIATNLFSGGTGGGGGAGATASEAAVISANAGSIATLNASQAAQDALIAVMPTQAQVDAIQAVQDAEDPYKTFDRQPDGSINWTRESNATGTIAAPAGVSGVVDTAITATGTNPVDGATIFASQAAQDTALAAKADQVALDAEIAATDAEQAAQDTAIAAKADQAALDAEIASTDAEQTAQDAAIALKADQTALDAEIASTDAEQTAQDAAIALKADQAALDQEILDRTAADTAHENNRAFHAPAATAGDNGKIAQVNAAGEVEWADAASTTGQMAGTSATYAGLPAVPADASATVRYHAWLTTDDVGTGTVETPQYPKGVYVPDATFAVWELAITSAADIAEGVAANFAAADPDHSIAKIWSAERLEERYLGKPIPLPADGSTLETNRWYQGRTGSYTIPNGTVDGDFLLIDNPSNLKGEATRALFSGKYATSSDGSIVSSQFSVSPNSRWRLYWDTALDGGNGAWRIHSNRALIISLNATDNNLLLTRNNDFSAYANAATTLTLRVPAVPSGRIRVRYDNLSASSLRIEMEDTSATHNLSFNGAVNNGYDFGTEYKGKEFSIEANVTTGHWIIYVADPVSAKTAAYQNGEIVETATEEDGNLRLLQVPTNYAGTDMFAGASWQIKPGTAAAYPFTFPDINNGADLLTAVTNNLLEPVAPEAGAHASTLFNSTVSFDLSAFSLTKQQRAWFQSNTDQPQDLKVIPSVAAGKPVFVDGLAATPDGGGVVTVTNTRKAVVWQTFDDPLAASGATYIETLDAEEAVLPRLSALFTLDAANSSSPHEDAETVITQLTRPAKASRIAATSAGQDHEWGVSTDAIRFAYPLPHAEAITLQASNAAGDLYAVTIAADGTVTDNTTGTTIGTGSATVEDRATERVVTFNMSGMTIFKVWPNRVGTPGAFLPFDYAFEYVAAEKIIATEDNERHFAKAIINTQSGGTANHSSAQYIPATGNRITISGTNITLARGTYKVTSHIMANDVNVQTDQFTFSRVSGSANIIYGNGGLVTSTSTQAWRASGTPTMAIVEVTSDTAIVRITGIDTGLALYSYGSYTIVEEVVKFREPQEYVNKADVIEVADNETVLINVDASNNTLYPFSTGETWAQVKAKYSHLRISGNASVSGSNNVKPYSFDFDPTTHTLPSGMSGARIDIDSGHNGVTAYLNFPADTDTGLTFRQSGGDTPAGGRMQFKVVGVEASKTVINSTDMVVTNPSETDTTKVLQPNGDGTATFKSSSGGGITTQIVNDAGAKLVIKDFGGVREIVGRVQISGGRTTTYAFPDGGFKTTGIQPSVLVQSNNSASQNENAAAYSVTFTTVVLGVRDLDTNSWEPDATWVAIHAVGETP